MLMLNHFELHGPNGTHDCLVFEFLGPNAADLLDARFQGERLPEKLTITIAKHALLGLDYLHTHNIERGGECALLRFSVDSTHAY